MASSVKVKATKHLHYQVDLEGCPRCGGSHEGVPKKDAKGKAVPGTGSLVFTPLTNPEDEQDLWAFCDVAGEPVLISTGEID